MLVQFTVKNFRSIQDEISLSLQATSDKTMQTQAVFQEGETALLKSVAMYGSNASGKSNILKAFFAFRTMILESLLRSNLATDLPSEPFKLSAKTENKPSFFDMTFSLEGEVFVYGFEMTKKEISKEWLRKEKGNVTLFERNGQVIKSNKNSFREASAILKKNTGERVLFLTVLASNNGELSQKIMRFVQKTEYISGTVRGNTLDYSFGQFLSNGAMAEKMKQMTVTADFGVVDIKADQKMVSAKALQHIPDKFKELIFKENSKIAERSLKFFHRKFDAKGEEIEPAALDFFTEESEGTQQFFALSAPIIDTLKNGKILFIDEVDASLHPILCQYLISIFNSTEKNPHNAQLIVTTHNTSPLSENFLRRDQIYFTDKDEKGATELFSLADISERKGVDFAKRYLEGRYDALPYIADFEDLKFSK